MRNMKTIQQLLELSKNPFYKFTDDEQEVLNDFLLKQPVTELKKLQKTPSRKSSAKTRVTVRNIVKKVDTYAPEAIETTQDEL